MIRRWLIRSFFLALLLLCVGAWVGSFFRRISVGDYAQNYALFFWTECGSICFEDDISPFYGNGEWFTDFHYLVPGEARKNYLSCEYRLVGFAYQPYSKLTHYWVVMLPHWLPTAIFGLLLCFVWRKTRRKMAGRGFPVEVNQS